MSVVLITGCSSGIGLATAVAFAQRGDQVVATVRSLQRSDAVRKALATTGAPDIRVLDVANDDSVAVGIASVLADYGQIDVVVSNAGIGIEGSTEEVTLDQFRQAFETNTLGSVRLLHAVLPGWRIAHAGRFIAISSMAGAIGQPFHDAYCASKFALEGLLESMRPVVARHGVSVSIVEPGPVAGGFVQNYGPAPARTANGPYTEVRARFQVVQHTSNAVAQDPTEVAEFVVNVARESSPQLRYQTSSMVQQLVGFKLKDLSGERLDELFARWL